MDIKKAVITTIFLTLALPAAAAPSYKSSLKEWTRSDKVYVIDDFEARMIWNVTYLSPDFRAARREKMSKMLEWNDADLLKQTRYDGEESQEFDVFHVTIYAGSSVWPEVGKDDGQWRIILEPASGPAVDAKEMERVPITQLDRELYPYIDRWSQSYYVRFPKTLRLGEAFKIRMSGIPAHSELSWNASSN